MEKDREGLRRMKNGIWRMEDRGGRREKEG